MCDDRNPYSTRQTKHTIHTCTLKTWSSVAAILWCNHWKLSANFHQHYIRISFMSAPYCMLTAYAPNAYKLPARCAVRVTQIPSHFYLYCKWIYWLRRLLIWSTVHNRILKDNCWSTAGNTRRTQTHTARAYNCATGLWRLYDFQTFPIGLSFQVREWNLGNIFDRAIPFRRNRHNFRSPRHSAWYVRRRYRLMPIYTTVCFIWSSYANILLIWSTVHYR